MYLSIIIPVYKVEKYIRKCLDSIFSQNVPLSDYEVIIVNDGTPDKSMAIVNEFKEQYPNIIIINQENQGLSSARNVGIDVSRGDYIWFVDSDDWLEPDSLTRLFNFIKEDLSDLYVLKLRHYGESGLCMKGYSDSLAKVEHVKGTDFIVRRYPIAPMQQYVIKSTVIKSKGLKFYPGIYHEDHEFAPRLLLNCGEVIIFPEYLYGYLRRDDGSITSDEKLRTKRKESILTIIKDQLRMRNNASGDIRDIYEFLILRNVRWFWNDLTIEEWKKWVRSPLLKPLWRDLKRIIFYTKYNHRPFLNRVIILCFLISPTLYKKAGKSI